MAIAQQFQEILGRVPTQDEIDYFGRFIKDGELQPHEIGLILQTLPEFQQSQLQKNTAQFGEQLNTQNAAILDQAAAAANSRFAGLGRPTTSALGASVLRAGGQLAQDRQNALASFYGRGLEGNVALGQKLGTASIQRGYNERDTKRQRGWDIQDYYRQKDDYESARRAASGWNAITPEFAIGQGLSLGGKLAGSYIGGRAGAGKGLFGG